MVCLKLQRFLAVGFLLLSEGEALKLPKHLVSHWEQAVHLVFTRTQNALRNSLSAFGTDYVHSQRTTIFCEFRTNDTGVQASHALRVGSSNIETQAVQLRLAIRLARTRHNGIVTKRQSSQRLNYVLYGRVEP